MSEIEIQGHCDEKFSAVREIFSKNFEEGYELGASYAVSVDGELVVDLWGGFASVDKRRAWEKNTIVPVASSSKVIVSLCGLLLIDRGLIDLDAPVAIYWPEFSQNGKEDLTVRTIFDHTSGLAGIDGMPGRDVLDNLDEVIGLLAAQKPWWEPGTACGYHAMTYGLLIGELVRRTTGREISVFFREEIADPLNIDFSLGLAKNSKRIPAEYEQDFDFRTEAKETSTYYRALGYMTENRDGKTHAQTLSPGPPLMPVAMALAMPDPLLKSAG